MRLTAHPIKRILSIALLAFCSLQALAQDAAPPKRILFVGNSFTYFYNLPQVVAAMAASQGVSLETRQSTVGGSNLEQHWQEEKGTQTRRLL